MPETICSIEGDPDLYGLGIRLGIYLQIIATLLATHLLPGEIAGLWDTNNIFLLAVLVAVIKAVVDKTVAYVEVFVMLQLLFAFLITGIRTNHATQWQLRGLGSILKENDLKLLSGNLGASRIGVLWRNALATAIACFNVWFWFVLKPPVNCQSHIFLFTKASPQPVTEQVYRVLAVLYLIARSTGYFILVTLYVFIIFMKLLNVWLDYGTPKKTNNESNSWTFHSATNALMNWYYELGNKGHRTSDWQKRFREHQEKLRKEILWKWRFTKARWISRYLRAFSVLYGVLAFSYSILAVELTLYWNRIGNIYAISATGQLIPFTIGLLTLLRIFHLVIIEWLEAKRQEDRDQKIEVDQASAVWRYALSDGTVAQFDTSTNIKHRHSLDDQDSQPKLREKCTKITRPEQLAQNQAVFPYPVNLSSTSLLKRTIHRSDQLRDFLNRTIILRDTGEWRYHLKNGRTQVFPANDAERRWSIDGNAKRPYTQLLPFSKPGSDTDDCSNLPDADVEGLSTNNAKPIIPGLAHESHFLISGGEFDRENLPTRYSFNDRFNDGYDGRVSFDANSSILEQIYGTAESGSPRTSSHPSETNEEAEGSRSKWTNKLGGLVLNIVFFMLCCPLVFTSRISEAYRRNNSTSFSTSSPSQSFLSDAESSERPRSWWARCRRLCIDFLCWLFCCPCIFFAFVYFWRGNRASSLERRKARRRREFENAYVRRHGYHSQPYLQNKKMRRWWRKTQSKHKMEKLREAASLVKKILKSATADQWEIVARPWREERERQMRQRRGEEDEEDGIGLHGEVA